MIVQLSTQSMSTSIASRLHLLICCFDLPFICHISVRVHTILSLYPHPPPLSIFIWGQSAKYFNSNPSITHRLEWWQQPSKYVYQNKYWRVEVLRAEGKNCRFELESMIYQSAILHSLWRLAALLASGIQRWWRRRWRYPIIDLSTSCYDIVPYGVGEREWSL